MCIRDSLDIVAANKEDGTVTLVTLDGALNALSTTKYAAGLSPYEVVAGRLDADQDADLVTSLSGSCLLYTSKNYVFLINPKEIDFMSESAMKWTIIFGSFYNL